MTLDRQSATASIGADVAPVENVELILDRTWSPYGQGSVTVGGLFPDLDPDAVPEPRFRLRVQQRFTAGLTGSEIAALLAPLTGSEITAPEGRTAWGETKRNLNTNPRGANTTGWQANDVTRYPVTRGQVPPVPHPLGIPTAVVSRNSGTLVNATLASMYNVDSLVNVGTPQRMLGVFVLVTEAGYRMVGAGGVTWPATEIPVNVWTYVESLTPVAAGAYAQIGVNKISGNASTTARAWFTGGIARTGTTPVGAYFDGDTPADTDLMRTRYLGTVGASASVVETRAVIAAGPWDGLTGSEIAALYQQQLNPEPAEPRTLYADLTIREVELDLEARTTTFQVATDDARLWDAARVATTEEPFSSTSIRAIVETIVERVGGSLEDGTADGTLDSPPTLTPGTVYRDFLTPLLQQGGLRLYATERRVWRLEEVDAVPDGTVSLSTARDVAGARPKIDRERGGFDSVVIEYKWTTPDGYSLVRYDVAGPPIPRKTQKLTYEDTPYPGPGAAAKVLDRVRRRRREIPVDAAPNYDARPGMSAIFTSEALAQQSGRLARVVFTYPARIMRADLYDLEEINPRSVRAIPPGIKTNQLPGKTNQLTPGEL